MFKHTVSNLHHISYVFIRFTSLNVLVTQPALITGTRSLSGGLISVRFNVAASSTQPTIQLGMYE